MDKLRSCPFCGGEARIYYDDGCSKVDCCNEECSANCWVSTQEEAITAWNRRAYASRDAEIERLTELTQHLGACEDCHTERQAMLECKGAENEWLRRELKAANETIRKVENCVKAILGAKEYVKPGTGIYLTTKIALEYIKERRGPQATEAAGRSGDGEL